MTEHCRVDGGFAEAEHPLRVLHVIGGGDTGGAMGNLLPLLCALRERGCDARVCCLGSGGFVKAAKARGVPVTVLPMAFPWDARVLPRLSAELSGRPLDVVHTHGARANLPVRLLTAARAHSYVLFCTVHSDLFLDYENRARARTYVLLDRFTLPAVDRVACVSNDMRRRLLARGYPRRLPFVVHPGLEDSAAHPPSMPVDLLARGNTVIRLGVGSRDTARTVGTVARLVVVKDLELFLRVADRLSRDHSIRAVIVGDGPERKRLQSLVREWGLRDLVTLTGEIRPARPALDHFGVFLLTSLSEGIPIAVLEAMQAGLPVVATAVGGLPEVVVHGETGFLVPRDRPRGELVSALAAAVSLLLGDEELRLRMGAAGAARVGGEFSPAAAAGKMLKAYRHSLMARALAAATSAPQAASNASAGGCGSC